MYKKKTNSLPGQCRTRFAFVSFIWFVFIDSCETILRPYSHSSLFIHTCLYGAGVYICHDACTFRLWLNEWMIRSDILHYLMHSTAQHSHTRATFTHTHTRETETSFQSCRPYNTKRYTETPCATNFMAFVRFKCQVENEKRLQANCDCSAFFFLLAFLTIAFYFWLSHNILRVNKFTPCRWAIFPWNFESETIVWSKQNSIETRAHRATHVIHIKLGIFGAPMNK